MRVELAPEDHDLLQRLVSAGKYDSEQEALHAAIAELVDRESETAQVRDLVQAALAAAERGEVIRGDAFLRERYEARLKHA